METLKIVLEHKVKVTLSHFFVEEPFDSTPVRGADVVTYSRVVNPNMRF